MLAASGALVFEITTVKDATFKSDDNDDLPAEERDTEAEDWGEHGDSVVVSSIAFWSSVKLCQRRLMTAHPVKRRLHAPEWFVLLATKSFKYLLSRNIGR